MAAAQQLGRDRDTGAHVVDLSDPHRQHAEVDENLCGAKLTPAERALFTVHRKDIFIALHLETRNEAAGNSASPPTPLQDRAIWAAYYDLAGTVLRTFAIITTDAGPNVAELHTGCR